MLTLGLFALLPLGLASLLNRRLPPSTAGFGFLAALAPVVAKGISSLISYKQQSSAAKQQEEQRKLEAQRADELAKQQWEAQQNSPAAQASRFKNTLQLGRLAGAMGGMDKVPASIAKYYQAQRTMPQYTGTSSYVPTAKKGGGGWDFAGGVMDALSYLDTDKLKGGGGMTRTPGINPSVDAGLAQNTSANIVPTVNSGAAQSPIAGLLTRLKGFGG